MSLNAAKKTYTTLLESLGKGVMNTLYPNDFEAYMIALELTDSQDNTIDYLAFPIMPENIQKTENQYNTVKKTANGITVLTNSTFAPQNISLRGNFGRSFKILVGQTTSSAGAAYSTSAGKYSSFESETKSLTTFKTGMFDLNIKTGYGVTKILKAIVSKSCSTDKFGKPMKLYFYNMALGESFLVIVPPNGLTLSQNMNKNMIWEYNLNLTAIAPLFATLAQKDKTSNTKLLSLDVVQKSINELARQL